MTSICDDFFWAIVLVESGDKYPITSALNNLKGQFFTDYNLLAAGSIMVALPTLIVFFALQKQFISGLALGSTKGWRRARGRPAALGVARAHRRRPRADARVPHADRVAWTAGGGSNCSRRPATSRRLRGARSRCPGCWTMQGWGDVPTTRTS